LPPDVSFLKVKETTMHTRSRLDACFAISAICVIAVSGQAAGQPRSNPLLDVVIKPAPPTDEVDNLAPGQLPIDFFDAYSWRLFVALNWPAVNGQRGVADTTKSIDDRVAPRVWETWKSVEETFLPTGAAPASWAVPETTSLCKNAATLAPTPTKLLADFNQGDDNGGGVAPLVAQNRTYVRYEIRMNKVEFDAVVSRKLYLRENLPPIRTTPLKPALPNGTIDIKAAWRELKPGENSDRYYKVDALAVDPVTGNCDKRQFVLIGFHIGQKTRNRPQWIWSTFEHVDNISVAPDAPAGTKPSLNDASKPQVLDTMPDLIDGKHPPKSDPEPVQVVFENQDNMIPQQTAVTNKKWHDDPRIQGSVLRFYQLIKTQWPTTIRNPIGNGNPFPSRRVANTTMETYLQSNSCIVCHGKTVHNTDFVWFLSNRAFPIKTNVTSNVKVLNDHAATPQK
jgi:hypothetical protein